MDHNMNDEGKLPEKFDETPWIYPLVSKGVINIMDLAGEIADQTGLKEETVRESIRRYLEAVEDSLREGYSVDFLGMGSLIPILNDDGELISIEFEESEKMRKTLDDMVRKNPSLN